MRVAAIYDIHGNLPALEAVIAEIRQAEVDHIVVGGDIVPGPMPRETLAYLLALDIPIQFIQGNCETELLEALAGADIQPEQYREALHWTAQALQPDYVQMIANWPQTLRLEIQGLGEVLFCHATPRDNNEIFTRLTPDERLTPIFEAPGVPLVVCGHTHMQFDRMIGQTRVVNAGSLGMPFGEPGAYWLLLDSDVEFRHTAYDLTQAAERVRATDYSHAQDFAARYILQPRPEAEVLEIFAKDELR